MPTASWTVTKLRWMAENEPAHAARTSAVVLPHDWLTWRLSTVLTGPRPGELPRPVTDRGDASGTGYFSPADASWLPSLAKAALGHDVGLPRLAAPAEVVGQAPWGAALSAGTGDNMGAALGLGLRDGDVVVSIGTSGTAFAVTPAGAADSTGAVAGFADATGKFLPLVATVNAARVLTVTARLLGLDISTFSELALAAPPGAGGLTLVPYLDGERTPNRPDATGVLSGLTTVSFTRENLARAAAEAVLCVAGRRHGSPDRDRRSGRAGCCSSAAARARPRCEPSRPRYSAPRSLVPEAAEYVAIGAARQAAWALAASSEPPPWPGPRAARYQADPVPQVREKYAALRDATAP